MSGIGIPSSDCVIDERSTDVWDDYHVVDGRLVTGQNPASATSTAKASVDIFDQL
jgi:putative intracellular protease/amidase